jgi:hypothetical protein
MLWEGADLTLRWTAAEMAVHQPAFASRLRRVAQRGASGSRLGSQTAVAVILAIER